jgi:hypothetical protein
LMPTWRLQHPHLRQGTQLTKKLNRVIAHPGSRWR